MFAPIKVSPLKESLTYPLSVTFSCAIIVVVVNRNKRQVINLRFINSVLLQRFKENIDYDICNSINMSIQHLFTHELLSALFPFTGSQSKTYLYTYKKLSNA
jgi:hypothetical protein